MNIIKIIIILLLSGRVFAGGAVGNGGGFAYCHQRFYAYDYLLTLNHSFGRDVSIVNLNQSIQYIAFHLQRLNDPLSSEFSEFFSTIYTQIPGKKFMWFQQKNLRLMYEPDLENQLPSECRQRRQAVYYFAPFAGVPYASYKYDPDLISLVQAHSEGALQVSYLWVHEWLWNHFSRDNFMALAKFNRLLHSKGFSKITKEEYAKIRSQLLR